MNIEYCIICIHVRITYNPKRTYISFEVLWMSVWHSTLQDKLTNRIFNIHVSCSFLLPTVDCRLPINTKHPAALCYIRSSCIIIIITKSVFYLLKWIEQVWSMANGKPWNWSKNAIWIFALLSNFKLQMACDMKCHQFN